MSKQKRCFDLIASVSTLMMFSPLMLLIGGLIKITSKGQSCSGRRGLAYINSPSSF